MPVGSLKLYFLVCCGSVSWIASDLFSRSLDVDHFHSWLSKLPQAAYLGTPSSVSIKVQVSNHWLA